MVYELFLLILQLLFLSTCDSYKCGAVAVWRMREEGRGGNLCLVHQISIKALFFLYNCWQFNKNHVHLQ